MKKNYALIGVIALALSLSACGTNQDNSLNGRDSLTEPKINETTNSDSFSNQSNTNLIQPTEPVSTTTASSVVKNDAARSLENQTDLLKDYSSAVIKTSEGDITVKFYQEAPITANNFLNLAQKGFYNGTKFHRIMKDFMIQGGDPLTKKSDTSVYGTGGPGYQFKNEESNHKLVAGNIAMANAGVDTNGSQFFIVTADSTPSLDGDYTNFGEVVKGMDVVRKIENSRVTESDRGELSVPVDYVTVKSVQIIK
jgi:cyclophilin family peptidyl-prolyl cis-trans isomerase